MLTREQVEGTIRKWYGEGQQFQSRGVRQKLDIKGDDRDGIARLHNYLKAMEKDNFIQRVPGDQKRNQFYTLALVEPHSHPLPAPNQVDAVPKESAWNKPQPANAWLIDRLGRIEDMLLATQQRLNSIENKLDKSLMTRL